MDSTAPLSAVPVALAPTRGPAAVSPPSASRPGPLQGALRTLATRSQDSFGQEPPADAVRALLAGLGPQAPLGGPAVCVVHRESVLPRVSAGRAFEEVVQAPGPLLRAAGLTPRGALESLVHGARHMLEDQLHGWAPLAFTVEPARLRVGITYLQGHLLRGSVSLAFLSDARGRVIVAQRCTVEPFTSDAAADPGTSGLAAGEVDPGRRSSQLSAQRTRDAVRREQERWSRFHEALVRTLAVGRDG